jgi:hypothetical protein
MTVTALDIQHSIGNYLVAKQQSSYTVIRKGGGLERALNVFNYGANESRAKNAAIADAERRHLLQNQSMNLRGTINFLRQLGTRTIAPPHPEGGICEQLVGICDANIIKMCRRATKTWVKFSGDIMYPVPAKQKFWSRKKFRESTAAEKWEIGRYAEDRLELCLHIADTLEEILKW